MKVYTHIWCGSTCQPVHIVQYGVSHSVMSDSETPWTVTHQAHLSMEFPGKNTGVGSHSLLQGIFPTRGSNLSLLHCRQILYHLSHQGSPRHVHGDAKSSASLYTGAGSNLTDKDWGEVEKESLLLCQAKGDTAGSCSQNHVPPGEDTEKFSSKRRRDQLVNIFQMRWWCQVKITIFHLQVQLVLGLHV